MNNKKAIGISLLGIIFAICMFLVPVFSGIKYDKVYAANTEFKMLNGASVRTDQEGGIRFIANLGSEYNAQSTDKYYMLIVPETYVSTYATTGGDYYALIKAGLGEGAFIANMETTPTTPTAKEQASLGLSETDHIVRGSLTNIKYDNSNVKFFGIAYKEDTAGIRKYATFEEGENERDVCYVASAALNDEAANYTNEEKEVFNKYVLNGFKKAANKAEGDEYSLNIGVDQTKFTFYKDGNETVALTGIPAGVNVKAEWSVDDASIASVKDGVITGLKDGTATVSVKVLGQITDVTCKVVEMKTLNLATGTNVLATTVTYGGKNNVNHTTKTLVAKVNNEPVTGVTYKVVEADSTKGSITTDGAFTTTATPGTVKVTAEQRDEDDFLLGTGELTLTVRTAMNCKFDFDMLALASVRGVNETDWGKDAYYILTQDIDYNGNIWIPIAATAAWNSAKEYVLSPVWKTMFATDNEYGITYDDFRLKGLNGVYNTSMGSGNAKTETKAFQSTINGNGYEISNIKLMFGADLFVNGGTTYSETSFIGVLGGYGVIKELAVTNIAFQTYYEAFGTTTTYDLRGVATGTVTATTLKNATAYSAGLFTAAFGTIQNCLFSWKAVGTDANGDKTFPVSSLGGQIYLFGSLPRNIATVKNVIVDTSALGDYKLLYHSTYVILEGPLSDLNTYGGSNAISDLYIVSSSTQIHKATKAPKDYKVFATQDAMKNDNTSFSDWGYWRKTAGEMPLLKNVTMA